MARFVARRVLQMALVLVGVSLVLFVCLFVVPGDPITTLQGTGRDVSAADRLALERRYHLDRPLLDQYANYLGRLARGDLGESITYRRPVNDVLGERLANTVRLAAAAVVLQVAMGVAAGVVAAVSRYSFLDALVTLATTVALGVPTFVLGVALQEVFAVDLGWLPLFGADRAGSIVLPAVTLAAVGMAFVARLTRGSLLEVLRADFVRTARAKGLSERRVVLRHALPTSMIPVVTFLGISFGTLLGGALITEAIFNWPGVGLELFNAIQRQDNPVVLGAVAWAVAAFVVVSLVVDVAYAALDPRVRVR